MTDYKNNLPRISQAEKSFEILRIYLYLSRLLRIGEIFNLSLSKLIKIFCELFKFLQWQKIHKFLLSDFSQLKQHNFIWQINSTEF